MLYHFEHEKMDMLNRKYLGQADQMQLHTGLPSIMDPLEKITKMQAELNENREQLLIQREAVRASARKVHNQRQRTGDAEACLMNAMREYLNQSGIELPSSITNAYAQLDTARNILGSHEDDYLTLERQLAGTEWSYMEMENDFYQFDLADLLSSDICPEECLFTDTEAIPNLDRSVSSIQSSNPSIASRDLRLVNQELHTLKEKFNALRQEQSELLEFEDFDHVAFDEVEVEHARSGASRIEAESFDILDRIFNLEVESQRLKLEEMDRKLQLPVCRHVISEPSRVTQHSSSIDRAVTESAVSLLSPSHSTKHTLQAWILDRLKQDVVQKTMYLNVLQDFEIPPALSESWEERATRYWSVDSSSDISEEENRTTNVGVQATEDDDDSATTIDSFSLRIKTPNVMLPSTQPQLFSPDEHDDTSNWLSHNVPALLHKVDGDTFSRVLETEFLLTGEAVSCIQEGPALGIVHDNDQTEVERIHLNIAPAVPHTSRAISGRNRGTESLLFTEQHRSIEIFQL